MPTALSWNYDSYALTHGVARALVRRGLDTWFFLSVDYAFGTALEGSASEAVIGAGGKVLGSVRHPLDAGDFSSYLIAAKASGAKVIALANGGGDMTNAVKQSVEFGIQQGGQTMVPLLCNIVDVHSLGLATAQGITLMTSFTWNRTDQTRVWSQRFFDRRQAMPTMNHAAVYSAVSHYLRAVAASGTADNATVVARMKAMPVRDVYTGDGHIRADGRLVHDMYLVRVKKPSESRGPWDYEDVLQTVPGHQAFRPLAEAGCPLGR
jgi:branched-chain amino acid transport system substrate-binding protein